MKRSFKRSSLKTLRIKLAVFMEHLDQPNVKSLQDPDGFWIEVNDAK